jgi:hypothetical protein
LRIPLSGNSSPLNSTRAKHETPLPAPSPSIAWALPDRSHENHASRAAALNLVATAIVLFNCRYLGRITEVKRRQGRPSDEKMISKLLPLGWDHINVTGDYV